MSNSRIGRNTGKPECLCARFSPIGQRGLLHPDAQIQLGGFSGPWSAFVAMIEGLGGTAQNVAIHNNQGNEIGDLRAVEICVPGEWVADNGVLPELTISSPFGTGVSQATWSPGSCKGLEGDVQCWKQRFYECGLDNTYTNFRDTGASITLKFADCPDATFQIPDGTGGWTAQVEAIAAGLASVLPDSIGHTTFCTNGCAGLPAPIIELPDMAWRYAGWRTCPGDKTPIEAIYNSDQREGIKLDLNVVFGPVVYFDRCVSCDGEDEWRSCVDGEEIDDNDLVNGKPICAIPCAAEYPALPALEQCDRGLENGCFFDSETGNQVLGGVTLIWKNCGGVQQVYFVTDYGLDEQEVVEPPEGAYFGDCATGDPIAPPDPECPVLGVVDRCIVTARAVTTGYQVSDFDPGDLEPGDQAVCNFSISVDDPAPSIALAPISGYTITENTPGQFSATWTWQGESNPQQPLSAQITLSTGETATLVGNDFALCSGGGASQALSYAGKQQVKEICYRGKASDYQALDGTPIEGPVEFCPDPVSADCVDCAEGDSGSESAPVVHEIENNTTDFSFSYNDGQLKWQQANDPFNSSSAQPFYDEIIACIEAGGQADLQITDQDGNQGQFTATELVVGLPNALFNGNGDTTLTQSGKVRRAVLVCRTPAGDATNTKAGKVSVCGWADAVRLLEQIEENTSPPKELVVLDVCHDVDGDPENYVPVFVRYCAEVGQPLLVEVFTDAALTEPYPVDNPRLVDCATGEPVVPPTVGPGQYIGKLWRFVPAEEGAEALYWQPAALGGTAVPHADIDTIFTGPNLQHANAPSHTATLTEFSLSTAGAGATALGLTNADTTGTDQLCLMAYIRLDDPVTLTDSNANTGERGMLAYQPCCVGDWEILSIDNTDSDGTDRAAFQPATIPAGIHRIAAYASDLSAFMGLDLRDENGDRLTTYIGKVRYLPPIPIKCYDNGVLTNAATGAVVTPGEFDRWCPPPGCCIGTVQDCA